MDNKHYYNLLMKSFEDAIRHGSGIINIRNPATNKEFKMPKQSTPIKDKSDKKSGAKKPMKK